MCHVIVCDHFLAASKFFLHAAFRKWDLFERIPVHTDDIGLCTDRQWAREVRNLAVVFVLDASDLLVMFSEVDASVALLTVSFYLRNVRPLLKRRLPRVLVVRGWSIRYAHGIETF